MGFKYLNLASAVIALVLSTSAKTATFDISWIGGGAYTMSGMFSYDDSLINTGAINESQIDTLTIEAFQNSVSIGTWDMADGSTATSPFNFNFDTTTLVFLVGGGSTSDLGQQWNDGSGATGVGFASGNAAQLLYLDGTSISDSHIFVASSSLSIKPLSSIPVPAAFWLFGSGLLGLIGIARRKKYNG